MRYFPALILCSFLQAASPYITYIGDQFPYQVTALTTDAAGNTYVTGGRNIAPNLTDVFITKLDGSGSILQTFTLTGKYADKANGIAVDSSGNIWIAGVTSSPDFPLHNPLQAAPNFTAGFLTKIAPDGTILFSTYLGGTKGMSGLNAVAVDASGNAYVTGYSFASDYPRTSGLPAGSASVGLGASSTAFFAKISAAGDKLLYAGGVSATTHECGAGSTCFLSGISSSGVAITVDLAGNAYIAGNTGGGGLPTTPGALVMEGIGAFVMKVNPSGSGLTYLTLLGSANYIPGGAAPSANPGNTVSAIAADAAGNAYITGATSDPNFPATKSVFQPSFSIPASQIIPFQKPPADAFVAKLNPGGTAMVWATFLGGTAADQGQSVAVDASGNVWISGTTSSADFPATSGSPQGGEFLVEFNSSGSALFYGSRFPVGTVGTAIALDATGFVHTAGSSGIVSTITAQQATAPLLFGITNAAGGPLAGRITPGELISLYGQNFGVATPVVGSFDSTGFLPTTLAGLQVSVDGVPAPLLYVSNTQINAVVPGILSSGVSHQVRLRMNGIALSPFRAAIDSADPQVFANADGSAAAINQDGSVNSADHPAPAGSIVSIWATGTGGIYGADGQQTVVALPLCNCSILGGVTSLRVTYAGTAPQLVNGVMQINFQIPSSPNAGSVEYFNLSVSQAISDMRFVYTAQ